LQHRLDSAFVIAAGSARVIDFFHRSPRSVQALPRQRVSYARLKAPPTKKRFENISSCANFLIAMRLRSGCDFHDPLLRNFLARMHSHGFH
jgi:hypothetical protein